MRRSRHSEQPVIHPLLAEMGLARAISVAPSSMLVIDRHGDIVYRNTAAQRAVERLDATYGAEAVVGLRAAIKASVLRATSFPSQHLLGVDAPCGRVEIGITFEACPPHGYVASWRDTTEDVRRRAFLTQVAEDLGTACHALTELSERLGGGASDVADHAGTVAAGAAQLNASIGNIAASVSDAVSDTSAAVGSADSARTGIGKLAESSSRVDAVSRLINGIAEQTNLLALNATIEAARAGTAGKGFAVVASEVKELAGRTSEATGQIGSLVEAIQSDSADAAGRIQDIVELINRVEAKQTTIAGAVEEQVATTSSMSSNVSAVAEAAQSSATAISDLRSAVASIADKAEQLRSHL